MFLRSKSVGPASRHQMGKMKLVPLFVAMFVGLAVFVVIPVLNYSGFCLSEGRYLTERELIDIGARDEFRFYPPHSYPGFTPEVRKPIAYRSFEDFVSRNPGCCSLTRLGRKGHAPTLLHRLLGHFATFVRVEYRVEEDVPDAPKTTVSYIAITNCDHPWNGVRL
jgi:hypothetical protein